MEKGKGVVEQGTTLFIDTQYIKENGLSGGLCSFALVVEVPDVQMCLFYEQELQTAVSCCMH